LSAAHALEMRIMTALQAAHAAGAQMEAAATANPAQAAQLNALRGVPSGRGFGRGRASSPSMATAGRQLLGLLTLLESPSDGAPTAAQAGDYRLACGELNSVLTHWRSLTSSAAAVPAPLACGTPN
ncbi:MAG: hypothetical protein ACRD2D_14355, partial [Terriglobales bacterium]